MPAWAAGALSVALHAAALSLALGMPIHEEAVRAVSVEIVETAPPPPEPEPERPLPRPVKKVAAAPPPDAPPPEPEAPSAPPPPNETPPPDAPPPEQAPVRIGLTLSSTTEAGQVAAPVGNTLYGKAPERASDPNEVQPYRASNYAPLSDVTSMPVAVRTEVPKDEYPREAARLGFEGAVVLKLLVNEEGRVAQATVLKDAGHGLGPAAVRIAQKYFRFKPARQGEKAVATEIAFTVRFELP